MKISYHKKRCVLAIIVLTFCFSLVSFCGANETCKQKEGPATQEDVRISKLLTEIEKACSGLKSYQATMKYDILQPLVDSQRIRNGKLYYQVKEGVVYARIHFDDLLELDLMDDEGKPKPVKFDEDYFFDGLWVHRTNAQTKTIERWEVARKRQARESFRLGQGPFPLPFAITKDDVFEFFTVKIVAADDKTPEELKGTTHLKLNPKPETQYAEDYNNIELWVKTDSLLPVQISYEEKDYNKTTVFWKDIVTDKDIEDSNFSTPKKPSGWTETVHPLEK